MQKVVSITLARAGSKGINLKNLKQLNGKPLIYYAIAACKESAVDEVWVSTENTAIKYASESYGANVIMRPKELSLDTSKCEEALLHFAENVDFDIMAFVQCTSPLTRANDINKAIDMIKSGMYDSVFGVTKEHWLPRWTMDMEPIGWSPNNRPRRQQRPETYVENGAFYVTTHTQLMNSGVRYGGKLGVVEIPLLRSFQVDSQEDFDLIEKLMESKCS